ncbi:phage major capsid protein [Ornithinimicrobium sp. Y1847]|uniref:phage major capsid protein n=1 Tax=Ornithinimicrobium sp. Y1847 TaxID=3405419 RepID=UPI003B66FBF1
MALASQTQTAAPGSVATTELTAEQVLTTLIQPLEAASQFLAAGPRIIDTAGPVRIPKMGGATSPSWHGENEQITEVDPTFDELHLLPSTMESIKTLTRYSNELARQSVVALDAAIKQRLVKDVADTMDAQLFSAGGDGITRPRGLFAYAGTQTVAVDGALTLDHLLDAQGLAMAANVNLERTKWVLTSREFINLRKVKDADGRYLIEPDVHVAGQYRLFGVPVLVTNRVPDTTGASPTGRAALVDFSQVVVARDVAPSVKVLDQTFAAHDQQGIRVVYRLDAAPANPEAIIKLTGITI